MYALWINSDMKWGTLDSYACHWRDHLIIRGEWGNGWIVNIEGRSRELLTSLHFTSGNFKFHHLTWCTPKGDLQKILQFANNCQQTPITTGVSNVDREIKCQTLWFSTWRFTVSRSDPIDSELLILCSANVSHSASALICFCCRSINCTWSLRKQIISFNFQTFTWSRTVKAVLVVAKYETTRL